MPERSRPNETIVMSNGLSQELLAEIRAGGHQNTAHLNDDLCDEQVGRLKENIQLDAKPFIYIFTYYVYVVDKVEASEVCIGFYKGIFIV